MHGGWSSSSGALCWQGSQPETAGGCRVPFEAQQEAENPWHELDVPTASHSDYAMGQVCIVEALMQGEGRYGLGPSQSILPNRLLRR